MLPNTVELFEHKYKNINYHYLNRYISILSKDYSKHKKFEKHHILPESLFPEHRLTKLNIKKVPIRLHFILHHILAKAIPDSLEMKRAIFMMSGCKKYSKCMKNSKFFEQARFESREVISKSMKIVSKKRVEEGKHNFQGGKIQKESNLRRVKDGTHCWLRENDPRIENGTHHMFGGKIQGDTSRKRVQQGTHNLQGKNNPVHAKIANGTHHTLNVKPWNNIKATADSLLAWKSAEQIHEQFKINTSIGYASLFKLCKSKSIPITERTSMTMIKYFRKGWKPEEDESWLEFVRQ